MINEALTAQDVAEKLNQVQEAKLSPEIQAYLDENLQALRAKTEVYPEDMEFVEKIILWLGLAKEDRETLPSIELMEQDDVFIEATKRGISLAQWEGLLHMQMAAEKDATWIDETFDFMDGKIVVKEDLFLGGCTGLTQLPESLVVEGVLDLRGCTSLTHLPENLVVEGALFLRGCTSITHLPESLVAKGDLYLAVCTSLTHLPENLVVKDGLNLRGCTSLTYLPENLVVEENLQLGNCTSLTHLPENLIVKNDLHLSENLAQEVKDKAQELKEKGQITGDIKYI